MAMSRDVMVNSAVTIVPRQNGLHVVDTDHEDIEVCQFAFELKANKLPWKESYLKKALSEQMNMILEKMRRAGMVKP